MALVDPSQHNTVQRKFDDVYQRVRRAFTWQVRDADVSDSTKVELRALMNLVDRCELATHHIVSSRRVARCHEGDAHCHAHYGESTEAAATWALNTAILFDAFADVFEPYARRTTPNVA